MKYYPSRAGLKPVNVDLYQDNSLHGKRFKKCDIIWEMMKMMQLISLENDVKISKNNLKVFQSRLVMQIWAPQTAEGCLSPEATALRWHTVEGQPKCSMQPPLKTSLTSHPGSTYSVILPRCTQTYSQTLLKCHILTENKNEWKNETFPIKRR